MYLSLLSFCFQNVLYLLFFFFSSRRRHTRCSRDWSSDVCSSDLIPAPSIMMEPERGGTTPAMALSSVDLPAPFGPVTNRISRSEERRVGKECRYWWLWYI